MDGNHHWKSICIGIVSVAIILLWKFKLSNTHSWMAENQFWCTIVGEENETINESFLKPLRGRSLVAIRQLRNEHPFINELQITFPPHLKSIAVAIYNSDPHLNWRGPHLLYQGYLERKLVCLILPSLRWFNFNIKIPPKEDLKSEETLIMIKPHAVNDKGKILNIINQMDNMVIVAERSIQLNLDQVSKFYAEHNQKGFFNELILSMTESPVMILLLRGPEIMQKIRNLVGPTDPEKARQKNPGSIRAKFGRDITRNAIHASDSHESAAREIFISSLW